jgi:hypothetical protein
VQERKLAHASLPTWWDDFRDALVLVQEGKLAHIASFPLGCSDVVQDVFALVLMKEGKLACVIFFLRWNHVVQDVLVLVQEGKLA